MAQKKIRINKFKLPKKKPRPFLNGRLKLLQTQFTGVQVSPSEMTVSVKVGQLILSLTGHPVEQAEVLVGTAVLSSKMVPSQT